MDLPFVNVLCAHGEVPALFGRSALCFFSRSALSHCVQNALLWAGSANATTTLVRFSRPVCGHPPQCPRPWRISCLRPLLQQQRTDPTEVDFRECRPFQSQYG